MKRRRKNTSQTIVNIIGIMVVASMILSLALVFIPTPEPAPTPSPTLPPPTTPPATATPVATATPTHSPTVTFTPADTPQPTTAVTATSTMTATVTATATPPATATPVAGLATPIPLGSRNEDTFTFAGHIHTYAEATRDGVRYIITGDAGTPLYAPGSIPRRSTTMSASRLTARTSAPRSSR